MLRSAVGALFLSVFAAQFFVSATAGAQAGPPACAGAAWEALAPFAPVRDAPMPISVVLSEGPQQDVVRLQTNGDVRVERYGLEPVTLCRLVMMQIAGLHRTLEAVGFPPGPFVPAMDVDEWVDVNARFDETNHAYRVALRPARPEPAGIARFRALLSAAIASTEPARTAQDRRLDEVRRLIAAWLQGRSLSLVHGSTGFLARNITVTSFVQEPAQERLTVRWDELSSVDTGHAAPNGAGGNTANSNRPSAPLGPPPVQTRTVVFAFRRSGNGWLLQRPAAMPPHRTAQFNAFEYPGPGEGHGVSAPVFTPRLLALP